MAIRGPVQKRIFIIRVFLVVILIIVNINLFSSFRVIDKQTSSLLYLMVLIDSHTISKSIDNDEKADDIFDSITDLDHTRNPRFRRDRFIHKHRSEHKNDFARQTEILKVTKPTETTEKTTVKTTVKTTSSIKATEHTKHHKSAKRRVGSLWRKFRGKNKKAKHNDDKERNRRISKHKEYTSESPSTKELHNSSPRSCRRKNRHQFILRKSESSFAKRDLSGNPPTSTTSKERKTPHGSKMRVNFSPQLKHPKKTTKNRVQTNSSGRKTTENLSKILATMTTELTRLKQVYGLDRTIPSSSYSVAPVIVNTDFTKKTTATPPRTSTTTDENDYPGTAQIEELLNDIKLKSLQMIVEQSPAVTDLITNTVTEATFEADPILTHVDLTLPGFYLSTFVSINDMIENSKRTAASIDFNVNNPVIITNTESYHVVARSIKDDTITLANKVEDMLQKELKNIFNKVKNKVSSDFRKEVSKAKCTLKDAVTKISSKLTPKNCISTTKVKPCTCPRTKKDNTTRLASTVQRHNRGDTPKKRKYVAKTLKTQETPNPTPTYDDYQMLTLYEQMLSKTHEANVRKMLSSPDPPLIKRRNHFKLSKRNAETLTDVKLREDVEKLYDDGGNMPDYDYVESQTTGSTANSSDSNAETTRTNSFTSPNSHKSPKHISESPKSKSTSHQTQTTESTTESLADVSETSYEGLSNKISYNDYVNGYKHYLKFQKEENNQNFSNLIKYQAHRHHNVDDIGKYILNKIPQLPNRQKRRIHKRFFDDTDIEYQEISTKNDDSWFRKHFYLFIDNGPPKKYYTSQTVPLKSALTEPNLKNFMSETAVKPNSDRQIYFKIGDDEQYSPKPIKNTAEMSLDDLSKILESYKEKQNLYSGLKPKEKENISVPPSLNYYTGADDIFNIKMYPQSFIGKLFGGKRRQVTKKYTTQYYPEMYMFNEKVPKRYRRNATTIEYADSTVIEDFVTKDVKREDTSPSGEEIKATVAAIKTTNKEPNNKFGFVDVDLVRRQTAVVKLHANSSPKKSKLKDFFKKFHFKKKKDKKHAKRYCEYNNYYTRRRTRFNPLQLMKDIFKVKPGDEYHEKDHDITMYRMTMPDYYMVSSHIDSFKPIRYDKPMSIEEMKQQIPNISDSFNYEVTTNRHTKPSQAHMYKLDDNDRNLLYHYNLPLTESSSKDNSPILTKPLPGLTTINETISTTNRPQSNTSTIINNNMKNMKETYDLNNIKETDLPSNVITVNVKTMSPMERPTPSTELLKLVNRTRIMTLDDMHHVLNRLQWKLAKSTKSYHRLSTPYHKRKAKPMPSLQSYTAAYAAYGYHKRPMDELTIKTKLTRIAKFPISQRQNKIYKSDEIPNLDFKDYLSFEEEPMSTDYLDDMRTTNTPEKTKSTMGQRDRNDEPNKIDNNGKSKYTDYFNDLLMWHHDILNLDKVPNPLWKNILKNIQFEGDAYTTPNMNNLMSEVNEMNLYLDDGSIFDQLKMSSPKMVTAKSASSIRREPIVNQEIKNQGSMNQGSMNQGIMNQGCMKQGRMNQESMNQGIVRSFAMHDNAIVTNKDMIIQGEAKYYQYNKQKDINAAPLSEFTLLNKNNDKNINKKVQKLKKKMKPKAKEKVTRRSSISTFKESPAILVDTTLLSYDDAVDSINTNIEVKKLSRNSQKSTKAAQRKMPIKHHPFLKTNKAPVQYFTTPLPMKSRDFDRFLKEHQMDVESVTSPMVELPNFVNSVQPNKSALKPSKSVVHQKPLKYPTYKHTPSLAMAPGYNKPMNLTKVSRHALNLNRIKNKSKETSDDFDRPKRFSELNKNIKPFFSKTTQEFNYYNLIKNKMKMFEKKATAVQKQSTEMFTLDPRNKEVEITIINFDDIDKITTNIGKSFESFSLPLLQKYGSTNITEYSEPPVTTTESYFNSQKEDSMHNELLYKDIFSERTTDRDTKETDFIPIDFKHTDQIEYFNVTSDPTTLPSTSTMPRLPYPLDFLKIPHVSYDKNPNAKEYSVPKRIHISSHHYKYDIFYNDDKKHSKPCNEDTGRPKLSINTATPNWMRQMKLTHYKTPTSESNTEMIKKIDRTSKRNRPARHVRLPSKSKATQKLIHEAHTAKRSTTIINQIIKSPTSTEYSARNSSEKREAVPASTTEFHTTAQPGSLPGSKTVQSKKWDHRKRLYKISALIGERLKFLMRNNSNSSSTSKKLVAAKQDKNMNRRNCSCSKTSTTAEAVFKEELGEEELGEEVEGFQIKYKPEHHTEHQTHLTTTTIPMITTTPQDNLPRERRNNRIGKGHKFPHDLPNDVLFIEPDTYEDQCYYETGPLEKPPEKTSTLQDPDHAEKHYEKKRDVHNSFTAKDVAALEVIVDLMKNTLSYEEKEVASIFNTDSNIAQAQQPTQSIPHNESTNSIQVHIAIPFDFQTGKKRSPLGPVRVRKVFSAKMYTPVDLEYQVHSYEGEFPVTYPAPSSSNATQTSSPTTVTTVSSETKANTPSFLNRLPVSISQVGHVSHVNFFTNLSKISKNPFGAQVEGLSPGMYLLVDKPNSGYALKPVKGKINMSDLKTRQVDTFTPTISMATSELTNLTEIETTSLRSLGKITLSKEFIAAVNNHLIELYENMSHVDKDVRKTRSLWEQEKVDVEKYDENKLFKRRIDWDAVKQYFGNDRVCNCKCKPYKTMCRACAASDAVIDELIFEFDNLGRYMQDHCTEIQTFFWMNPNGGQKLRESVNRIDKSLTDYYNRAKGKCQGKTCKTFTTYIDKRHITKNDKTKARKNNTMFNLLTELTNLADDLNKTVSLQACFNEKLKKEGQKFLNAINSCIMKKTFTKRSMEASPTKKKLIKNVYSLDNVNVNIICKPDTLTTQAEIFDPTTSVPLHSESSKSAINDHVFDYDLDLKHKKRKGLKKLLPRKSSKHKLFSYYVLDDNKKSKIIYKRSADDYIATPLISDGGGAFWYDYIKGNTFEPRLVRESSQETSPNFEIAVVQKGPDGQSKVQKLSEMKKKSHVKPFITSRTSSMREIENTKVTEVPTDLINNINQLLQLFGSLQDMESMNMHANRSTMFLRTTKEQITSPVRNLKKSNKYVNKIITKINNNYISSPPTSKQTLATTTPFPKSRSPPDCTPPPPPPPPKCPPPPPTCPPPPPPKCPSSLLQCPPPPPPKCPPPPPPPPPCDPTPPPANCTCGEPPPPPGTCKCPEPPSPCGNQTCEVRKADVCIKETTALKSTTKAAAIETEVWDGKESNLYLKLKTATLKFLDNLGKGYTYDDDKTTQMPFTEHILYSHSFEKFSDRDLTRNLINLEDSSQITTNMSPTIVIINEYGQSNNEVSIEPTKDADSYKNLLLSIIQFETNRLHDEWHRLAYGNENEEGDYKRSVMEYAKADKSNSKTTKSDKTSKKNSDQEYDVLQGLKGWNWKDIGNLEIPDPNPDKGETKCNGLLNKLVSKMGIKVVCGKKKAAKKTREVTNKFRLNKKRIGKKSRKTVKPTDYSMEEACDTRRTSKSSQICDIKATFDHVLNLQNILSPNDFENFVKNISCYQFRSLDKNFFIPYQRKGTRWDWIRNKRSLKINFSRIKDGSEFDDEYDIVNFNDDNDFFEKFVKGDDGIYKIIKRKKRTVSIRALDSGLRNIPPLKPPENEIYVMAGDAINLNCYPNVESNHPYESAKYTWRTDRVNMLKMDNVQVCGMNITINNVSPKNVGTYTCSGGGRIKRKVRLNVMNIPTFDVIFQPVYKTSSSCSYDDLKAIQSLGPLMAEKTGCTKSCSMRIDEPVCQVDRATNMSLVSAAVVVSLTQQPVPCSVQCRRDIFSSLVMLSAANAPALASAGVVISKDGVNETLYPCMNIMRPVVTHALKKKDSNGHREYHNLMSKLTPGTVDVVLVCPAGYYLISEQKICSTCPADTSSVSGDNTCSPCPHGTRAPPGADTCTALGNKPRRYDWWWYPSCGYMAAFSCVFISCGLCVCLAMCVHLATQEPTHGEEASYEVEENRCAMDRPTFTAPTAHNPCTRPLSPSRVILARFFKPSLTSSRATDSQETKFELWKERNIPPPVPPIDFDI